MEHEPGLVPRHLRHLIQRNHGTFRGWVRHVLGLVEWRYGLLKKFGSLDPLTANRLVFVCLGNINRSAFAGAVARKLGDKSTSIGLSTTPGASATPAAMSEARRRGFSLDDHRATAIDDYQFESGDALFVMEVRHAHALALRGIPKEAIHFLGLWATPARVHLHDPHTLSTDYLMTCFTLIETAVCRIVVARRATKA
jgi:protein-tyrosine phosphatase